MKSFKKRSKADWKKVIASWRASGLSAREYCQQNSITEARFYSWRKRLGVSPVIKPAAQDSEQATQVKFLPVRVQKSSADKDRDNDTTDARIDIFLRNGHVMRISGNFCEEKLALLLQKLEGQPC